MALRVKAEDFLKKLSNVETKSQAAFRMFATEGAKKFENYAKQNRLWTDRT